MVIGIRKRLELVKQNPQFRTRLWENVFKIQKGLRDLGFDIGKTNTCITPVFIKTDTLEATLIVKELREVHGIFTSIVVYPVIPKGLVMLRIIPTAEHSDEEINQLLLAFESLYKPKEIVPILINNELV